MKRILTVIAIFMAMLCGSTFLVSCSNNYKKMHLVVEYCVSEKDEEGKWVVGEWKSISGGKFDYHLSSDNSRRLHMRVKVEGTSKKVSSLYISQSSSSSVIAETTAVQPNEVFELYVNTIGRAEFTITPSNGGENKSVSFGVNVYRELSAIYQSEDCIPAAVVGASVRLEDLDNLIKYEPLGETNQTGVNFSIAGVGTLANDGNVNLLQRAFIPNTDYSIVDDGKKIQNRSDTNINIELESAKGYLTLDVSHGYLLSGTNNVVKLEAVSKYNDEITTIIYVYIVENFNSNSLLVSYNPNVELVGGFVPTEDSVAMPVPNKPENATDKGIIIYNSSVSGAEGGLYNHIEVYTYTNASIYSYESNPGIELRAYVNGERYYYDFDNEYDLTDSEKLQKYQDQLKNVGIQISPLTREEYGVVKLVGLKIETNPTALNEQSLKQFDIRLELDFNAFDFSASGKSPRTELTKEFRINIEDLASGVSINQNSCNDNLDDVESGNIPSVNGYDSTKIARLYTSYAKDELGMKLNIYAIPSNAINGKVYVSFYDKYGENAENLAKGTQNNPAKLQLVQDGNYSVPMNSDGEFEINFKNKAKMTYLRFNELAKDIDDIREVIMVCRVQSTPDMFANSNVDAEYITYVSKIKVVGSIDNVLVYKNLTDNSSVDTLTDDYLATGVINTAYINFSSVAGEIDYEEIIIKSNGNIKFLNKDSEWKNSLTANDLTMVSNGNAILYKLTFRVENECEDLLIISAPNGVSKSLDYQFVNIVEDVSSVKLNYEKTYVKTFNISDKVDIEGVTQDGSIDLNYLALQSGKKVQFIAYGDGDTTGIKNVTAISLKNGSAEYGKIVNYDGNDDVEDNIKRYMVANALPTYNSGAINIPQNHGNFFFDIEANSVGFTSIVLVKVEFYSNSSGVIELEYKYFLYEVAVYTPATRLTATADEGKDKIVYINENYPDVAQITFDISLNSATRTILFSSSELNDTINSSYGSNGTESIYGIEIEYGFMHYQNEDKETYFDVIGLKNVSGSMFLDTNRVFTIKALRSLLPLQESGIDYISFDMVIHQFGEEVKTTRKNVVIYFDDYNKAENIVVTSGIDRYNNVYLSLAGGKSSCEIEAYASNAMGNVTYKELGFRLYQIDTTTGLLAPYVGSDIVVEYLQEENIFNITAQNKGGLYQLELYSKDSGGSVGYKINITVSDGLSEATAYLIGSLAEFKVLASGTNGKYYKLSQDINISSLDNSWWSSSRIFEGNLDGAMTINDPQTGNTISRRYSLTGLHITNASCNISNPITFGLFRQVTGVIKNIIFVNAKITVELDATNTANNAMVNIAIVAGVNSGVIENCSVNIVNSEVKFKSSASDTKYNIGLVAGLNLANNENGGKITYTTTDLGSNYSRLVDVGTNAGKLTINVEKGNETFGDNTDINIGGVVGLNYANTINNTTYLATIITDYADKTSNNISDKIKAVVNIEVNVDYDKSNPPMNMNSINVGGIVGFNEGVVSNIAVSGSIVANDRVNVGGVVGQNTGNVQEVANFGAYIMAGVLIEDYQDINGNTLVYHSYNDEINKINQEQNIGGIIGYNNKGIVDNVRMLFVTLASDEVSVEYARALIQGVGNVAGIIGKSTNTQLTHAYVENFVDNQDENNLNYNIIGINGANVAGLIAQIADIIEINGDNSKTSASVSFVQADFNIDGCLFNEFGYGLTYDYVYFIGDVFGETKLDAPHNNIVDNSYIIKNIINIDMSSGEPMVSRQVKEFGVANIEIATQEPSLENDVNYWLLNVEDNVNSGNPYLKYVKDAERYNTLTLRPTEIIVNVDQNYFDQNVAEDKTDKVIKYDNGIYIQYVDDNETVGITEDDRVVATAVVYYIENGNNTHKLVSDGDDKGLIEKTVLPNIAGVDGTYSVGIVSGSSIAMLTDGGSTITFTGIGRVELKFVSAFDRSKEDIVVIFVENPLHEDVFNIAVANGLESRTDSLEYVTRTNVNSSLTLNVLGVDAQMFNSSKLYMSAEIGKGKALVTEVDNNGDVNTKTITDIDVLSSYLSINPATENFGNGRYGFGRFNIVAGDLLPSYYYLEIPVTVNVYLNLQEYIIDEGKLSDLVDVEALLESKEITIKIYNKATALTVSSDIKAESGEDVNIVANLTTGYVNTDTNVRVIQIDADNIVGSQGNKVDLNIVGQDTIDLILTADNDNAKAMLEKAKAEAKTSRFSIWDLFNASVSYSSSAKGLRYEINIRLKDEYRYLNLEGFDDKEWVFKLNISNPENVSLSEDVLVAFAPQQLLSLRLENYSHLVAGVGSNNYTTEAEFVSSQTESSLIVPGESGLVKIFAEYSYSYFENITISSSRKVINGKEFFIRYQQMVYNKDRGVYESYAGITAEGESLTLKKVSYKNADGQYEYDGVLFVRTILDEFVGVRQMFTINVSATTYDLRGNETEVSTTKTVISQYRPGVYLGVENAISTMVPDTEPGVEKQVYLVEQNSGVATIIARVYGYEFNVIPTIKVQDEEGDILGIKDVAVVRQTDITQDSTGAYVIKYSLSVKILKPFKVIMFMTLVDNSNTVHSPEEELIFYPVEYMLDRVNVKNTANGDLSIALNSSRALELDIYTKNTTPSKTESINEKLKDLYLELFHVNQIINGQEHEKTLKEYYDNGNPNFTIKRDNYGVYYIEADKKTDPINVYFDLWYGYNLNTSDVNYGKVTFSIDRTDVCSQKISTQFRLLLTIKTTEDAPSPINNVADFMSMAEGENYILMEDLVLNNWEPLNTAISSLDGNGKRIIINSFSITVGASVSAGLFATVSENTILKNVVVDISGLKNSNGSNSTSYEIYIRDENVATTEVNFGLIAGVNKGLIYNCEVVSVGSMKHVEIIVGSGAKLTFGALVGINEGNITNSRVGTEYFEQLTYVNNTSYSTILECGRISFKAQGIVAGFVGENKANSIISSCFVANTSIENTKVGSADGNRTAGFVATNAGTIAYSYSKGLERNILTTKSTTNSTTGGAECVILASGNGSVAGFAYLNSGTIHDCYSNTVCRATSSAAAGFVYNTLQGKVYQCYSATRVESDIESNALATELPFVGVGIDKAEAQLLLSNEDMLNCYYLDDGTEYDTNYIVSADAVIPKGLTLENFAVSSNLNNFSFITDNSEQQLNGVWTYSTAVDHNRTTYPMGSIALPELTSANMIARSLRYMPAKGDGENEERPVVYANGYELGSQINPYIIRNVEEYDAVFVNQDRKTVGENSKYYMAGYVRFIDDISFATANNEYLDIKTRSRYILGDRNDDNKSQPYLTLIDGNGMTISNVIINHAVEEYGNLGLFSEVYSAVIKGLNIDYKEISLSGSSKATHVGGIAGTAYDTYLIDLSLTGGVTLSAKNVVGGVVGKISGTNSGMFNITSNLSAEAGNFVTDIKESIPYEAEIDADQLSYAGGIAGIIDIGYEQIAETYFNLNKLTTTAQIVRSDRAGGIAGYLGANVNANRLTYTISNSSQIFGNAVAGGIVADNYADIQLSQANADIDRQYEYDVKFAEYIRNPEVVALDASNSVYGNLSAITGDGIVGGFAGINNGGKISNSLTKANISNNDESGNGIDIIGGFIGKTYSGNLQYVYAQNYIDISVVDDANKIVGGIIGYAANNDVSQQIKVGLENVVSANWYDKQSLTEIAESQQTIRYLVGYVDTNVTFKNDTSKDGLPIIHYGKFNVGNNSLIEGKIKEENIKNAQSYQMEELYYIPTVNGEEGRSTQIDIFNTLFVIWPEEYWVKDYTKFMPNLKLDNSTGFIEIKDQDDIALMAQMPDRNFILVNNVQVNVDDSNYVVDTEFRGVLIAALNKETSVDGVSRYYEFMITLNADTQRGLGAGFFRQTSGARIANIGFNYKTFNLCGTGCYNAVGGVSSLDFGSRFEQIEVSAEVDTSIKTIGASVSGLGSIVGVGYRSNIISCLSDMDYDVTASRENATVSNIGGIVGSLDGKSEDENSLTSYKGLISSSTYTGSMKVTSISAEEKKPAGTNVGGIAGWAQFTRISDCQVRNETTNIDKTVTYSSAEFEFAIDSGTNNIGGILGSYEYCSISHANADIKISGSGSEASVSQAIYKIGGLVGVISHSDNNEGVDSSYSKLSLGFVRATDMYIGGIVGEQSATNSVVIDAVVSQICMEANTEARSNVGENIVGQIVLGGIVGWTSANNTESATHYCTNITNAFSIIEVDIEYNHTLIAGGLIGQASGSYLIDNSASTGYVKANNQLNTHFGESSQTLSILGGMIGLVGEASNAVVVEVVSANQTIARSYTTLTLSTANVYRGQFAEKSHTVYTNAIIGYSTNDKDIQLDGALYSSDYTLALEEGYLNGTKLTGKYQNVTANFLMNAQNTLASKNELLDNDINGFIGDGWKWSRENKHLPFPLAVEGILVDIGILKNDNGQIKLVEDNVGKSYAPRIIDEENNLQFNEYGKDKYSYFLLRCDIVVDSCKGNLNGVLLGSNYSITSSTNIFGEIGLHSAVSNLTFELKDAFNGSGAVASTNNGTGAVASTNNGTVFMIGVQYENTEIKNGSAGLVAINKGAVIECYNIGNSPKGDGAGLVWENTATGTIVNSFFTGSFSGGEKGYALVNKNDGYMANSYSAGVALKIIKEDTDNARYSNVEYDYYANYVLKTEHKYWADKGVIGVSTSVLQGVEDNTKADSKVFTGWKVYSMHNWEDVSVDATENVISTYNYGYPVHKINQLSIISGSVKPISIGAKQTGDGTFEFLQYTDENTGTSYAETDPTKLREILEKKQGKLVKVEIGEVDGTEVVGYYNNSSFLINNLGVLYLINETETKGKYFELEIDIVMENDALSNEYVQDDNELLSNWKGIGTDVKPFEGVFTTSSTDYVYDETIIMDVYTFDKNIPDENICGVVNNKPKTITNLTGGALFASTGSGALIHNINFKNSQVSKAPVIDMVVGDTLLYKVNIVESVIASGTTIAGFVNQVGKENSTDSTVNLYMYSIDSNDIVINGYNEETESSASTISGLINTNYGTINIINSFTDSNMTFDAGKVRTVNGLINVNGEGASLNVKNSFNDAMYTFTSSNSTNVNGLIGNNYKDAKVVFESSFVAYKISVKSAEVDGSTSGDTSSGSVAGLVNTNEGTISVLSAEDTSLQNINVAVESINGRDVAGVVYNNIGTIILNSQNITLSSASADIDNKQNNAKSVSGLAYENSGTIESAGDRNILITIKPVGSLGNIETGVSGTEFIAGLVGTMTNGSVAGFTPKFTETAEDSYIAKIFAGAVATFEGGRLGYRTEANTKQTGAENKMIEIFLSTATADVFGGIVAVADGEGYISNVKLSLATGSQIGVKGNDKDDSAYGLIIGKYLKQLGEIYYELEKATTFNVDMGKNVGGIIGYAENGEFNFKNEQISNLVTVKGYSNVGGFIGQYEGSDSLEFAGGAEYAWAVGGKEDAKAFASVQFAEPSQKPSGYVSSLKVENFGGLIGYWNSTAELSVTTSSSGEDGVEQAVIVNANNVLNEGSIDSLKNIKKTSNQIDVVISNIGGVVGKTNGNIVGVKNNAIVGYDFAVNDNGELLTNEHDGKNPISAVSISDIDNATIFNTMLQLMYVGGVVGLVDAENCKIRDCINLGGVYGMYAVGGLVGGSNKNIEITQTGDLASEAIQGETRTSDKIVNVVGLTDVGGIIGMAHNKITFTGLVTEDSNGNVEEYHTRLTFDNIVGIVNVGGIVGNANDVVISRVAIGETGIDSKTLNIMGNINVGAVAGIVHSSTSDYCMKYIEIVNTTVCGTIFDYKYTKKDVVSGSLDSKYDDYYYLPTNIGGVVGTVLKSVDFGYIASDVYVCTDEEFVIAEGKECTVNATFNHLGNITTTTSNYYSSTTSKDDSSSASLFAAYLESYYTEDKRAIRKATEAVQSGIGGFAGSLNGEYDGKTWSGPDMQSCIITGDVYARFGINVGGMVGYLNCDILSIGNLVAMGNGNVAINVAGRVFVGGYVGKTVGFVNSSSLFNSPSAEMTPVVTSSMVNVQRYKNVQQDGGISYGALSASYVGGVIGYVTGEVRNIVLTNNDMVDGKSKIKVFNSDSSELDSNYVGALIGRMDGRLMQGCEIAPELCDAVEENGLYSSTYDSAFGAVDSDYSPNGIIQSPTVYNYGGLVGLVNAPEGSNGDKALIIDGKHYYPFTVDTVHNQDYAQGRSSYEYDETSGVLSADAHYINESDIKISASLLNDLYEYRSSDMSTLANNHNPVKPEAFGWAKEYTLFRNLARVQVQANETTGNSIQVIYSADYINEVYARFKEIENSNGATGRYTPIEIAYTIYKPINQPARLYCKYGIAEVVEGFDPNSIVLDGNKDKTWSYESSFEVYYKDSEWNSDAKTFYTAGTNQNEGQSVLYQYGGYPGGTGRKAFWHHVSDFVEIGVDMDAENIGKEISDYVGRRCDRYQFTFGYSYYTSSTYLQRSKFNLTSGFLTNSNSGVNTVNSSDPVKPVIFAFTTVFGIHDNGPVGDETPREESESSLYSKSGSIFEVTGTVYTPKFEMIDATVDNAWKNWGIALSIFAGIAALVIGIFFPPAGLGLMAAITAGCSAVYIGGIVLMRVGIEKSLQQTGSHFNTIEEMSLGYLSSSYGRQIGWENGVMNPEMDSYLEIERTIELTKATGTPEVNQFKVKDNLTVHPTMETDFMRSVQKEVFRVKDGDEISGTSISGSIDITIPVTYFNCTNAGVLPSDYEDTSIIEISQNSQDARERMLNKYYGVTAISVPKYVRVDNELYCCVGDDEVGGLLYANYKDVEDLANKKMLGNLGKNDIIDVNGYAYILKDAVNTDNKQFVVPDSHASHLKDFYNIKQTVEKGVSHYLSTIGYNAQLIDEKELLRWREAPAGEIADNNKFIYDVTFKYSGTSTPNSAYISRTVIKSEKVGDDYYSYYTETEYVTTSSEVNTLYFALDGSGKETITVVLKPYIDGGNGLKLADMNNFNINEGTNFYLVVDKENGYIPKSREFVLCTKTSLIDTISNSRLDGNQISILTPVDENLINDETVTIKFADDTSHSLKDIRDNFEAYVKEDRFIIYNGDKVLISNVFAINDDKKLCYKTVDDTYAREIFSYEGQEAEYFYHPRYGGEARNNNYANRYVYKYEFSNGTVAKFYTRFNYGNDFFDGIVKQGAEGLNDVTLKALLVPSSSKATQNMRVTLAESARVSLSPAGACIYWDYAQGNKDNMVFKTFTTGSITCYSDDINA